jgi:hypothetical protein
MATAWAVPLVSTFAAIVLVATFQNRLMLVVGPLIAFFGTAGALLSRDLLDEADEQSTRVASVIHTLVVHGIAFLAFSAVYLNKLDSWISAPLAGMIGGILILETLERGGIAPAQRIGYVVLGWWRSTGGRPTAGPAGPSSWSFSMSRPGCCSSAPNANRLPPGT